MLLRRRLSLAALGLGLAAPFVGSPYRAARGRINVDDLATAVGRGDDHIEALELATWIRDRRPGLRVIDVRPHSEFEAYAIPTAESLPIELIGKAVFTHDQTAVLYSESGVHAAQAWVFLRAQGLAQVYFLRRGLAEWIEDVMYPAIAADAAPAARSAFEKRADLSRYFGGSPQLEPAGSPAKAQRAAQEITRLRGRGC
jgi:rhodanese-related sulfurtransferase